MIVSNLGQSSVGTGAEIEGRLQWVRSETDSECQQSSQPGCEKKETDSVGVQWVRHQWVNSPFTEFSVNGELTL